MKQENSQTRFVYQRKPRVCPVCHSKHIATILYGLPFYSEELEKDLHDGKITLGGCCVSPDSPLWQCADCKTEFCKPYSRRREF